MTIINFKTDIDHPDPERVIFPLISAFINYLLKNYFFNMKKN